MEQGEEWGSWWPYVLPAALALFLVMVVFGGVRYATEIIQASFRQWWIFAVFIIIVLAVVAVNRDRLAADDGLGPAGVLPSVAMSPG